MQRRERIEAQREHGHDEALDAFIARKLEIDAMLQRLTESARTTSGSIRRRSTGAMSAC